MFYKESMVMSETHLPDVMSLNYSYTFCCRSRQIERNLFSIQAVKMGVELLYLICRKKEKTKKLLHDNLDLKDFLRENIQRAEDATEQRHKENRNVFNSLIEVLKSSVK